MPTLPVEEINIVEVACESPASLPTRKFPFARASPVSELPAHDEPVPVTTPVLETCIHCVPPLVMPEIVSVEDEARPFTVRSAPGFVVPMPTLPVLDILIASALLILK